MAGSPHGHGPCIRFLFVGAAFRLRLPSDPASRRAPLPSAIRFDATPPARNSHSRHGAVPDAKYKRARPFGRTLPVHCELKARVGLEVNYPSPHRRSSPSDRLHVSATLSSFTPNARTMCMSPTLRRQLRTRESCLPGKHVQVGCRRVQRVRPCPPARDQDRYHQHGRSTRMYPIRAAKRRRLRPQPRSPPDRTDF